MNIDNYHTFLESSNNKFPNIRTVEYEGFNIIVGRDAASNDHLTFNIADDDDIWMHVKGTPGSHVVIKVKDRLPSTDIIKYAAQLTKQNSKAKDQKNATIVYCKRKFVKKEKSMNVGQVRVDYINSNTIDI